MDSETASEPSGERNRSCVSTISEKSLLSRVGDGSGMLDIGVIELRTAAVLELTTSDTRGVTTDTVVEDKLDGSPTESMALRSNSSSEPKSGKNLVHQNAM